MSSEIKKKLLLLREQWQKAGKSERKIIEIRAKMLKLGIAKSKPKKKDSYELAKKIFEVKK